MDAQFQLGLELTNLLNPLTSTLSALGSLALVKAIKKAGSDALTEIELASFLGRNRIDSSIEFHFRQVVSRSEQKALSRYLDIIIDSGAGPTVQNALRNPELLSMIIQISMLCSVHESTTLAQAIIEAIEANLKHLRADLGKVPDYPSLCGTLRVCKQETADFQWGSLFDAVEQRIDSTLLNDGPNKRRKNNIRSRGNNRTIGSNSYCIRDRTLPFPVLQVLLLSLHTLQHFPDERILVVHCTSGISTIIVWCYHVLGLNVKLMFQGHDIYFGEDNPNVIVRESTSRESHASILHPNSQREPLFNLTSREGDPFIGPELRKKARGYGFEIIKQLGVCGKRLDDYSLWVRHQSLRILQLRTKHNSHLNPGNTDPNEGHGWIKWSNPEVYNMTEERLHFAYTFLFNLGQNDGKGDKADEIWKTPAKKHLPDLAILVLLLLSLTRVEPEDLESCNDFSLSTQVQQQLKARPYIQFIVDGTLQKVFLGLMESFDILSHFIHGPNFVEELNHRSVLESTCGWSLYFDSINYVDPVDVSRSTLRIVRGVPLRDGVRKTQIVDGPTDLRFSPSDFVILKNEWKRCVEFFPGVSLASRGTAFVGQSQHDAFQVTQSFTWHYQRDKPRQHLLGFREMLEISLQFSQFLPCQCERSSFNLADVAAKYIHNRDLDKCRPCSKDNDILRNLYCIEGSHVKTFSDQENLPKLLENNELLNECVFSAHNGSKRQPWSEAWLFHVSRNPAARWMELCDLYPRAFDACNKKPRLLLRGPETCFQCAFEAVVPQNDRWFVATSAKDGNLVTWVLL